MCILLTTTEHPDYPLVVLSNRDEFFKRRTGLAAYRVLDNHTKVLAPLDLGRPEHGTWIGVTTTGKLAVLLNYREEDQANLVSEVSRGIIPLEYLQSTESDEDWVSNIEKSLAEKSINKKDPVTLRKIGGFSFVYGQLSIDDSSNKIKPLNILSNRGDRGRVHVEKKSVGEIEDTEHQTTFGLSNSLFYDPWPKVKRGEKLLSDAVNHAVVNRLSTDEFVNSCLDVLSTNTFDMKVANDQSIDFVTKSRELRNSIFIPPLATEMSKLNIDTMGKYYGTRTQTVILLSKSGVLHYYERNLHDTDTTEEDLQIRHFEFSI